MSAVAACCSRGAWEFLTQVLGEWSRKGPARSRCVGILCPKVVGWRIQTFDEQQVLLKQCGHCRVAVWSPQGSSVVTAMVRVGKDSLTYACLNHTIDRDRFGSIRG